jgi:APA family basic amino acid/polyamine antiporter
VNSTKAPALLRRLGRFDVLALTFNNIVGSGIFTLAAALVATAGRWSFGVLFFTIALVALMAVCTAEVASRFDVTGGPVVYANAAFGPTVGFFVGALMYLSRLSSFGAIAVIMLDYSAGLWPSLGAPVARIVLVTLFIGILAAVNIRGVVYGAFVSHSLTLVKAVPLVTLALAGLWLIGRPPATTPSEPFLGNLGGAVLLAFYACMGFETATVVAGEIRNPPRDLPLGMVGGTLGAGILYALLLFTCLKTVPDLARSSRPLADAAGALAGPAGDTVISMTAVVSCAATLALWMMVTPRLVYAMALQGDLPSVFARVGALRHTPWVGILGSAVIVWLLTISGTFVYLATFSAITRLITYASTCGALMALRRQAGPAPVSIPFGRTFSVIALVATGGALLTTTGTAVRDIVITVVLAWIARTVLRWWNKPEIARTAVQP